MLRSKRIEKSCVNTQRKARQVIRKLNKDEIERIYQQDQRSIREIAEMLGCSKDMVYRCLKEYGIKLRSNARRSSLRQYDLKYLEDGVKLKGLRGFARELRVDNSTLLHHIRIRKGIN
jgi:transcriptional antiterminator